MASKRVKTIAQRMSLALCATAAVAAVLPAKLAVAAARDITGATISEPATAAYTSYYAEPEVAVSLSGETLTENTDYTLSYSNNYEVGTATVDVYDLKGTTTPVATTTFEIAHLATADAFDDFEDGAWYLTEGAGSFEDERTLYMDDVLARGLMTGYVIDGTASTFGPNNNLTRAEAATILYRMANPQSKDTTDSSKYATANTTGLSDVEAGVFYTAAVNWCVENGVVTGYADENGAYTSFGPNDTVTREQLATMLSRYIVNFMSLDEQSADLSSFSDEDSISSWARSSVSNCLARNIMTGVGGTDMCYPQNNATRAEAAKMFAVTARLDVADAIDTALTGFNTEDFGIVVSTFNGKDTTINADEQFTSASMIKLAILAEFMQQVDEGTIALTDTIAIAEKDMVAGTGVIKSKLGAGNYTLDDLAKYMIAESDNTATNVLIDKLGKDNINKCAQELGLTQTVLNRKMLQSAAEYGENYTSSADCATVLAGIYSKTIASEEMCVRAEEYLLAQSDTRGLPQGLPEGVSIAHKTGTLAGIYHDGGIVYAGDTPYVIVVLTKNEAINNNSYTVFNAQAMKYLADATYRAIAS